MSRTRPLAAAVLHFGVLAGSAAAAATAADPAPPTASSEWAYPGPDGRLAYRATPAGDRIVDFSFAGYRGGGVPLPSPAAVVTVRPGTGSAAAADDSAAVQRAIDDVSARPLVGGVRGAVLLAPGTFHCPTPIVIAASGVVLRGSGAGADGGGTTLVVEGTPHVALTIRGPADGGRRAGGRRGAGAGGTDSGVRVTDAYVPSGSTGLTVADASAFKAGDVVHVVRPVTPAWVAFMAMDHLVRDGKPQSWVGTGSEIRAERTVAAVADGRLTFDVPLTDSLDAKYLGPKGATVVKVDPPERVTEVGVESLRVVAPPQPVGITDPHHAGVHVDGAADAWVRDLTIENMVGSVSVGPSARRVTVRGVTMTHAVPTKGAAKPADLACDGGQVLFDRCGGRGDDLFYFATGGRVTGPNVLLNCTFHGTGHVQPHMRWATGLLVDRCEVPDGGIDLMNRGIYGSGHGWTVGWSVAWNCSAKTFLVQRPPGCYNWSIGCRGAQQTAAAPGADKADRLPQGTIDSPGAAVAPASLYLAQLRDRLGPAAVSNAGY